MRRRAAIGLSALLLCTVLVSLGVAASRPGERLAHALMQRRWGIQAESLRRSAGGYMIDFRFRVTDPRKAAPLLEQSVEPQLIDLDSGARLTVSRSPKIGALRSRGGLAAGHVHFMVFVNSARQVRAGDRVAVVIGDFRSPPLTVE